MAESIVSGLDGFEKALVEKAAELNAAAAAVVVASGAAVVAAAKRNFEGSGPRIPPGSGGPLPRTQSGDLKRTIELGPVVMEGPGVATITAGPTIVYARRIELGFHGTDDKGRHYNQKAYPYWTPALAVAAMDFPRIALVTYTKYLYS